MTFSRESQRKKKEVENFPLPKNYGFLFYFVSDGKYARLEADSREWEEEFTTVQKLKLEKGNQVNFKILPVGVFIWKGPFEQMKYIELYLEEQIDKGFNVSDLEMTNALQNALAKVDLDNLSYSKSSTRKERSEIACLVLHDEDIEDVHFADDNDYDEDSDSLAGDDFQIADGNNSSGGNEETEGPPRKINKGPEQSTRTPIPNASCSNYVWPSILPTSSIVKPGKKRRSEEICRACHQYIDRTKQVILTSGMRKSFISSTFIASNYTSFSFFVVN